MTITLSRVISFLTDDFLVVEIPRAAWAEVARVAEDEFDADITVHEHEEPGAYHGRDFTPFPHYLIEVTLDESRAEEFMERMDPLVDDVVERYTQHPPVPIGR